MLNKRILQSIIMLASTTIIICINFKYEVKTIKTIEHIQEYTSEIIKKDNINTEKNKKEKVDKNNYLEFIVDVTSINIGNSKTNYIIVGNTATEQSYNGEIHLESNDIDGIINIGNDTGHNWHLYFIYCTQHGNVAPSRIGNLKSDWRIR